MSEPTPPAAAFSVPEFCQSHRISRSFFYELVKQGDGPRLMKAGRRTLISQEAAAEWRERMTDTAIVRPPQGAP